MLPNFNDLSLIAGLVIIALAVFKPWIEALFPPNAVLAAPGTKADWRNALVPLHDATLRIVSGLIGVGLVLLHAYAPLAFGYAAAGIVLTALSTGGFKLISGSTGTATALTTTVEAIAATESGTQPPAPAP